MFAAQIAPATLADVVAEVRATALAIVAGDPRGDSVVERALTTVAAANHLSPSTYRLAALSAVVKGCSDVVPVADETLEGMLLLPFDERAALVLVGLVGRSEERRVGKECVRPCRSRLSPDH